MIHHKKILKSLICFIWILLNITPFIKAQEFASPEVNPFSLTKEGARSSPAFADIDQDSDLDFFTGFNSGDFGFYEGLGTADFPTFGDFWLGPFNISSIGGNATPFMVDLDNDGDFDMLAGGSSSGVWFYENIGTQNTAAFNFPVANPFSLIGPTGITKPYMIDIDNDEDLDLFMGSSDGNIYFYENTGIVGNPVFASSVTNPFGLMNVGERSAPSFSDIDGDSDYDALIGARDGNLYYFENIGTPDNAAFDAMELNPFNLQNIGDDAKPFFSDLDNDGDLDLMVGSALGDYYYFENITVTSGINQPENVNASIYPNPSSEIITIQLGKLHNGEWDLIITDLSGKVLMRKQSLNNHEKIVIRKENIGKGFRFAYLENNDNLLFLGKLIIE